LWRVSCVRTIQSCAVRCIQVPTLDADAHANSIARIFPRLGETGTTQEIIDLLAR